MTFAEVVTLVNGKTITIHNKSDDSVFKVLIIGATANDTIAIDGTNKVISINPTSDLILGTDYYVKVETGALKDTAGNNYAGIDDKTSWEFTAVNLTINTWAVSSAPAGQSAFKQGDVTDVTLTMSDALVLGTTTGAKIIIDGLNTDTDKTDADAGKLVFSYTVEANVNISADDFDIDSKNDIILTGITGVMGNNPDLSSITSVIELGDKLFVFDELTTTFTTNGVSTSSSANGADDFTKTANDKSFTNAEVVSVEGFVGDGYATAKIKPAGSVTEDGSWTMVGLTDNPTANNRAGLYKDIDYAVYFRQGKIKVYGLGVPKDLDIAAEPDYISGDSLKIERIGTEIKYYHISATTGTETLIKTTTGVSATTKLHFDAVFYEKDSGVEDVKVYQKSTVAVDATAPMFATSDPIVVTNTGGGDSVGDTVILTETFA